MQFSPKYCLYIDNNYSACICIFRCFLRGNSIYIYTIFLFLNGLRLIVTLSAMLYRVHKINELTYKLSLCMNNVIFSSILTIWKFILNVPPPLSPPIFIHTSLAGMNPSCQVSLLVLHDTGLLHSQSGDTHAVAEVTCASKVCLDHVY